MAAAEPTSESAARRASGSSFYAAMRILPPVKRETIFEIYAFCRAVDDIADDSGPRPERLAKLAWWRSDVDALYADRPSPRLQRLAIPIRTFGLRREDFLAIIDGMEMDVLSDIRAPDMETLDLYCDRVASAVGRLCVKVFGMEPAEGIALAYHLGRALQLTNILRDLDEDAAMGRLYLPREALRAAGITATDPTLVLSSPELDRACTPIVERARQHFYESDAIMRRCPRWTVMTPKIMAEAYKSMLESMVARGWSSPRRPVRISRPRLLWAIVLQAVR